MIWLPVCAFGGFTSFAKDHSFADTVDLLSYLKKLSFYKKISAILGTKFHCFLYLGRLNSDQLVKSFLGYSLLLARHGNQKFFNHSLTSSRTQDIQDS